jgi:hypothetical protein
MSSAIQPVSTDRLFGPALLPGAARRLDKGVLTPPLWPSARSSAHLLMNLDDVAFRIMEENLMPFGGKGGAVIGEGDIIVTKMLLEGVNVIRAKGDMAAFDRIDMLTVPGGDIQIPLGKMHLHAAFGGEFDVAVIARILAGGRAREILRRDRLHLQYVDVEALQAVDVL